MEVKARAKFIRISPKKVRLVADLIRGLDVAEALVQLQFSQKNAALPLVKLIKSAIANGEENEDLKRNNLFVKAITVDGGPTLKRWMPKAMGRATPLIKRSSHINLILAERVPTEGQRKAKKEDTKDDLIKIEDLKKIDRAEKSDSNIKATDKKLEKEEKKSSSTSKKIANKIFNRRTGS